MEFRAGLGNQRIGGEKLQRFFHGGEMTGAVLGDVALAVLVVVADATEMREKLAGGDRRVFLWEHWAIFLHGSVEVELAAFEELQNGNGSDGLGDGAEAVQRGGSRGGEVFEVGHAEAGGPDGLAILYDGDGNAGNAVGGHEGGDRVFDLGALLATEPFFLGKEAGTGGQRAGQG